MPRTTDAVSDAASAAVRLVRRRGALPALVTGGAVAATLFVMLFAQQAVGMLGVIGQDLGIEIVFWGGFVSDLFLMIVPFSAGFTLALWLVAPIADVLELRHVIARAILATGIGATVVFVVRAIAGVLRVVSLDRPIFSNSFPAVDFLGGVPGELLMALQGSLIIFVSTLPLGVLAGVLLWLWRQKHPARYEVAGLIDV